LAGYNDDVISELRQTHFAPRISSLFCDSSAELFFQEITIGINKVSNNP